MAGSSRRSPSPPRIIRRDDFPAFAGFARGYLHEDVIPAHGSAEGAMRAFCDDADGRERRRLLVEMEILVRLLGRLSLGEQRRALAQDLGVAWRPGGKQELPGLLDILRARAPSAASSRSDEP